MIRPLKILAFDAIGGLAAGTITLLAEPLLTSWYSWPAGLVAFFGWANIGYGCYSGILCLSMASGARLPPWTVQLLILANSVWALHCVLRIGVLAGSASMLGISKLAFEGLWVGTLAPVEARFVLPHLHRSLGATDPTDTSGQASDQRRQTRPKPDHGDPT
jgi:hypothetical protein